MANEEGMPASHSDWPAVLEWAEAQGVGNLKERLESKRWLHQEAATTLTICLAGMGGSLAYAAPLINATGVQGVQPLAWGAAALCVWLACVSVALIWFCLLARPVPMLHHEARPLAQQGYSLPALREVALGRLQERIEDARAVVERTAKALNTLRLAAAASPVVFVAGALLLPGLAARAACIAA